MTRTLRNRKNEGLVVGKAMMMIVARGKKGSVVVVEPMMMIVARGKKRVRWLWKW